jgi:acetyl-CoA carboxylase, biotin carboxylase subunit
LKRVLIANRGEIALRAVRACHKLRLEAVAVYSDADRTSAHVRAADRAICIGPAPSSQSYLNAAALITAALGSSCDALYPGYGFLAEKSNFAAESRAAGLTFVGPGADVIAMMGDKVAARRTATKFGIPVVPGSENAYREADEAAALANDIGYPLLLKAAGGGGGRGMRIVQEAKDFASAFAQASAEAAAAFAQPEIYLERYFPRVRHIEIQIFGDAHGNAIHLWERDCSIQRRYQKLVEEAPSPVLDADDRRQMAEAAVTLVRELRYEGAGTVEFLYDLESGGWFFIEMNTRIQVEHPVTEEIFGVDLVAEQLKVAAGERLSIAQPAQPSGRSAIEFRINAEDPSAGFRPCPGVVSQWRPPEGPGLRFDSHVYEGYSVPPFYDSLLGKLIVKASSRGEALAAAQAALDRFAVAGIATTIPFHRKLLSERAFRDGSADTRWVEREMLS